VATVTAYSQAVTRIQAAQARTPNDAVRAAWIARAALRDFARTFTPADMLVAALADIDRAYADVVADRAIPAQRTPEEMSC